MYKCNVDYPTIIITNLQSEVVFIVFMERAILLQNRRNLQIRMSMLGSAIMEHLRNNGESSPFIFLFYAFFCPYPLMWILFLWALL